MAARACSKANKVFFEPQPLAPQEQPNGVVRYAHAAGRQFLLQSMERQMRCLLDPLDNESPVRIENALAMSAHPGRRDRTSGPMPLRPLHHRGNGDAEPFCYRTAALARKNRRHNTFPQVIRKRSGHAMLASCPASILNHKPHRKGIVQILEISETL